MSGVVGNENLPNAYIKKISIYNSDTDSKKIVLLDLCVKDVKNLDGSWGWFDDKILRDNMSIICVLCYNPQIINSITRGELTLSPKEIVNHPSFVSGDAVFKRVPIKLKKFKKNETPGLHSLNYRLKYTLDSESYTRNTGNAAVFVASFVDFQQMTSKIGATVPRDYSTFHGPIQSDYIYRSGKMLEEAQVLIGPDGMIYSGPTHSHEGQIMAGSKHGNIPHPLLSSEKVTNLKIKDFTKYAGPSDPELKNKKFVENYFSNLYYSTNRNKKVNSFFFLNMSSILLTRSRFGKEIAKYSPEIFSEILNHTKVSNMIVKRIQFYPKRAKKGLSSFAGISKVYKSDEVINTGDYPDQSGIKPRMRLRKRKSQGTPEQIEVPMDKIDIANSTIAMTTGGTDSEKNVPLDEYKMIFDISELEASVNPSSPDASGLNVRGFKMTDHDISLNDDSYSTYMVDVKIIDPTIVYINNVISQMETDIASISEYIYRLTSSSKYYDYDMEAVRQDVEDIASIVQLIPDEVTARYVKYVTLVSILDDMDIQQAIKKMNSYIKIESLSRKSAMEYLRKYKNLYHSLKRRYQIKKRRYNARYSRNQKIYQTKTSATISISNTFPEAMNFKNYEYSFSYHDGARGNLDHGLYTLTDSEFLSRASSEVDKHGNFVLDQNAMKSSTEDEKRALLDVISYSRTFVTPTEIHTPEENIKIDKPMRTPIPSVGKIFGRFSPAPTRMNQKMSMLKPRVIMQNNLGNNNKLFVLSRPAFNKYTFKTSLRQKVSKEKDIDFLDSRDYLGDTSPFVTEGLKDKTLKPTIFKPAIAEKLNQKVKINFNFKFGKIKDVSMKKFNLRSKDNFLAARKNMKPMDLTKMRKIPYSIKTLIRPVPMGEEVDVIKLPETSAYMRVKHFSIQKIKYLHGFVTDMDGNAMIKRPLWSDIDNEKYSSLVGSFVCMFEEFSDDSLGITPAEHMRLNVHDGIFMVTKESNQFANPITTPSMSVAQISQTPEYTTTNIVLQPRKRDAINDKYQYIVERNPLTTTAPMITTTTAQTPTAAPAMPTQQTSNMMNQGGQSSGY